MAGSNKKKGNLKSPQISINSPMPNQKKVLTQFSQPISYDNLCPVWSFKRISKEAKWNFVSQEFISHNGECADPTCVMAKLAEFEKSTWREIKQQTYGYEKKTKHHFIEINKKLHNEAKKRLDDLQITENFFSLRLGGKIRIYGILQSQVFEILWYDNEHEIYPCDK